MTNTNKSIPAITVRLIMDSGPLRPAMPMYVADGPDGHTWLLKRTTEEAALRDGLEYFLTTRAFKDGRWVL